MKVRRHEIELWPKEVSAALQAESSKERLDATYAQVQK